ncbi:MAG: carbohydrate kinase [Bifidobacteriaceae bacterium]|jgi:fructokinase|nr:carbohydrate kinase [Bifidobacteriaceae bacterium]
MTVATTHTPLVLSIGEILWDMLPSGKRAGGAPTNFVYHATMNGTNGSAISAVGNDALGDELVQQCEAHHIGAVLERNDYPTGTVKVSLQNGIPQYTIIQDVAWDHIAPNAQASALVRRADAICFGTLGLRSKESRATILGLLDEAPANALKYFDINIREKFYSKDLIEDLLQRATVFKLNDEELVLLRTMFKLPSDDTEACAWFRGAYDLDYVILTAGGDFSTIVGRSATSTLPTPHVEVVDTVSAGDSFSGAFTAEILKGASLAQAHRAAVNTAAFVCTQAGAWPEYPSHIPDYVGAEE